MGAQQSHTGAVAPAELSRQASGRNGKSSKVHHEIDARAADQRLKGSPLGESLPSPDVTAVDNGIWEEEELFQGVASHPIDCNASIASSYQSVADLDEFFKPGPSGEPSLARWSVRSTAPPAASELPALNEGVEEGDEEDLLPMPPRGASAKPSPVPSMSKASPPSPLALAGPAGAAPGPASPAPHGGTQAPASSPSSSPTKEPVSPAAPQQPAAVSSPAVTPAASAAKRSVASTPVAAASPVAAPAASPATAAATLPAARALFPTEQVSLASAPTSSAASATAPASANGAGPAIATTSVGSTEQSPEKAAASVTCRAGSASASPLTPAAPSMDTSPVKPAAAPVLAATTRSLPEAVADDAKPAAQADVVSKAVAGVHDSCADAKGLKPALVVAEAAPFGLNDRLRSHHVGDVAISTSGSDLDDESPAGEIEVHPIGPFSAAKGGVTAVNGADSAKGATPAVVNSGAVPAFQGAVKGAKKKGTAAKPGLSCFACFGRPQVTA